MRKLSQTLIQIFFPLLLLVVPMITNAQGIDVCGILDRITNWIILPIFSGLVIIMFAWAGILYLTAKGDPSKVQAANKAVIWALVGVGVGLLANLIEALVAGIIGTGTWSACGTS